MRIVFAGSSDFAVPALQMLLDSGQTLLAVSQPERPAGRHLRPQACSLACYAASRGAELFQPVNVNDPSSLERIRAWRPELLVTASYGALLKKQLRCLPALGALNLHPSLLPRYRGATPVQSALLEGEESTGVSIFRLSPRLDAGPIYLQRATPIAPGENFTELQNRLARLAASLLAELLPQLESGAAAARPQEESQASYTRKIGPADLWLDWQAPAARIHSRIRAFSFTPGARVLRQGRQLKLLAAQCTGLPAAGPPGTIAAILPEQGFLVNCADAQLLITLVQPAGKKRLTACEYLRGARLGCGEALARPIAAPSPPNAREEQ